MQEPGLDEHEWITEWEQLSPFLEESPVEAIPEVHRLITEMMEARGFEPPPGPVRVIGNHNYYDYRGYRLCLSYPHGDFICILTTRRTMNQFIQDILASEP